MLELGSNHFVRVFSWLIHHNNDVMIVFMTLLKVPHIYIFDALLGVYSKLDDVSDVEPLLVIVLHFYVWPPIHDAQDNYFLMVLYSWLGAVRRSTSLHSNNITKWATMCSISTNMYLNVMWIYPLPNVTTAWSLMVLYWECQILGKHLSTVSLL